MKITQETFNQAADSLAATGKPPTIAAVRAITGGSFTTLTPMMQAWKAAQVPVADRLTALGRDLWAVALATAQAGFDAERASMQAEREREQLALADVLAAADLTAAELESERMTREREAVEASRRIGELEAEIKALQEDLRVAQVELASARATVETLEKHAVSFEKKILEAITQGVILNDKPETI